MKDTQQIYQDIKERGHITEQELKLIQRRINDKRIDATQPLLFENDESVKLSPAQNVKGLLWLKNLWKTPTGAERRNNPFGYREQEVLNTCDNIYLIDFMQHNQAYFFYPVYRVQGKDASFEYYLALGKINIIG